MRVRRQIKMLRREAARFHDDDAGTVMVLFAMALVVFLGLVAMSFDLGRLAITQTELQSYADSVALAAAGELDGRADSITRARAAAALVADTQTYGTGNRTMQGSANYTLTFYATLPAQDTGALVNPTTDPLRAAFVRAEVTNQEVTLVFAAAFAALGNFDEIDNVRGARATAGFTSFACDVTPLMFCLPSPAYTADGNIGSMINLRSGGQGAPWGPGNFGFLDVTRSGAGQSGPCAGLAEAQQYRCLLGGVDVVDQCYGVPGGVDTLPGQRVGLANAAMNTRFDMYTGPFQGAANNPLYAPAPNVIKGLVGGNGNGNGAGCVGSNPTPSPDTAKLPQDDCMGAGCGRFGDGNWNTGRANYVATNYGGVDPHPGAQTRWQYYKAEIDAAGGVASSTSILTGLSESGRPSCAPVQAPNAERRVVIAAGIDCNANPISGAATGVPVQEYFRLFLTEPVGADSGPNPNFDIWAEIVGSAGNTGGAQTTDGIFRNVVQLYR